MRAAGESNGAKPTDRLQMKPHDACGRRSICTAAELAPISCVSPTRTHRAPIVVPGPLERAHPLSQLAGWTAALSRRLLLMVTSVWSSGRTYCSKTQPRAAIGATVMVCRERDNKDTW
jgi:hypothetical protein